MSREISWALQDYKIPGVFPRQTFEFLFWALYGEKIYISPAGAPVSSLQAELGWNIHWRAEIA